MKDWYIKSLLGIWTWIVAIVLLALIKGIVIYREEQREWQAIERVKILNEVCHGNWEQYPFKRASENVNWFRCLK